VEDGDVQAVEPLTRQAAGDVCRDIQRAWQFAKPSLSRDFPRGGRAHQDGVFVVADDLPGAA
jgi:hypothetical protein